MFVENMYATKRCRYEILRCAQDDKYDIKGVLIISRRWREILRFAQDDELRALGMTN